MSKSTKVSSKATTKSLSQSSPLVAIVMGSKSDWGVVEHTAALLSSFEVPYHAHIVSAHRTPHLLYQFAQGAEDKGYRVIIAAAGGAAHLPGMVASMTTVPVLGVPVPTKFLDGLDSLLSIVQMPRGVPVGTLAVGEAGAINAAWLALQILATTDSALREKIKQAREATAKEVEAMTLPKPMVNMPQSGATHSAKR